MSNSKNLVSITRFSILKGKPGPTIRLMCRESRIGCVKIGNQWLIDLDSDKTKNAVFQKRGRPVGSKTQGVAKKRVRKQPFA